jgi:hypothetical protein
MSTAEPTPRPLTPEERRRSNEITGWAVTDITGAKWLAAFVPPTSDWDSLRNQYYDDRTIKELMTRANAEPVIFYGLTTNYDITGVEAAVLLKHISTEELTATAWAILISPENPAFTYSEWVQASLITNNIPLDVRPDLVPAILHLLVQQRRTIPPEAFCGADIAKRTIQAFTPNQPAP